MSVEIQIRQSLLALEHALKACALWQPLPPPGEAFASQQPFCLDTMTAEQWLQWVFLPRMHALLDSRAPLPQKVAILPYFEMAMAEREAEIAPLLAELARLDALFGG